MKSIAIALMISIITVIAISGEAVNSKTEKDMAETPEGCPYIVNTEYSVSVKGSVSSVNGGYAHIHYNASEKLSQSYSLWFRNTHHYSPHSSENGIIYFVFHCISKSPSPSADISRGRMYINKVWLFDENKKTEDRRCAFYEKINNTMLRVSISKDVSCDGLSDLLYDPHMSPRNNKGSMLMIFNGTKAHASTTTTDPTPSISKRYDNRRYVLQNYGNRPNLFLRTVETTEGDISRRLRRHATQMVDEDVIDGAAMALSSHGSSRSDANDNDVSTALANNTDWLHRQLENNKELRGPESSVMPSPKTNVIRLAGANPFALLLANRVHNNKTGSIKPLGLWDQFFKIFNN